MYGPGTMKMGEKTDRGFPVEITHRSDFVRGHVKSILIGQPAHMVVHVGEQCHYLYEIDLGNFKTSQGDVVGIRRLNQKEYEDMKLE